MRRMDGYVQIRNGPTHKVDNVGRLTIDQGVAMFSRRNPDGQYEVVAAVQMQPDLMVSLSEGGPILQA